MRIPPARFPNFNSRPREEASPGNGRIACRITISILAPVRRRHAATRYMLGGLIISILAPVRRRPMDGQTHTICKWISILVRRRRQKQTINAQIRIHIFVHFAVKKHQQHAIDTLLMCYIRFYHAPIPPVYCVWEASAQHSYKINGSPVSIRDFLPITSILF